MSLSESVPAGALVSDQPAVDGPATPAFARRWQRLALGLAAVELLVLYAPTLVWLWERWTLSVWHNAHGLLTAHLIAISPLGKDMKLQAADGSTVYQFEYLTLARSVGGGPHGW